MDFSECEDYVPNCKMLTLPSPRQQRLWCPSLSGSSCSSSGSDFAESPPVDDDPPFEVPIPEPVQIKKIRNVRKSNIHKCAVCGDRPTGYHYDVLSCNGCKTFFRRTVINRRRFTCSRGGGCEFTKDFRCACRACRFAKCVQAGMNPKAIQFPSATVKESPDSSEEPEEDIKEQKALMAVPVPAPQDEDYEFMLALDMIVQREKAAQVLRSAQFPIFPKESLRQVLQKPNMIGRIMFNETTVDSQQLEAYRSTPVRFWMVADLFLTVEFAKTFMIFQEMNEVDKQYMLSRVAGAVQGMSQAYYSALADSDSLAFPDGINALHFQLHTMKKYQYEQYYRDVYCRPVDVVRRLQLTLPEFVIFKTLALFSPDTTELSAAAAEHVLEKREQLITIFRKLLIKEYGAKRGTQKLADCLFALSTFMTITEKRRTYLSVAELTERLKLTQLAQGIYLNRFNL